MVILQGTSGDKFSDKVTYGVPGMLHLGYLNRRLPKTTQNVATHTATSCCDLIARCCCDTLRDRLQLRSAVGDVR